jgi:hypothetical protein
VNVSFSVLLPTAKVGQRHLASNRSMYTPICASYRGDNEEKQLKRHRRYVLQLNKKPALSRPSLIRRKLDGCNAVHIIGNRNELRECFTAKLAWVCKVYLQEVVYRPWRRKCGILIKRGCQGRWNGGWKIRSESCARRW